MIISGNRLETENTVKYHYFLFGGNLKKVLKKLDKGLPYHRFIKDGPFNGKEIIYDVPNNLLSNAGLVLSKQIKDDKTFFKVRKISTLPGGYKRPSQNFFLAECGKTETPKDFPSQIANAISNSYANVFTIDLVSVVRQTVPKYEIRVKGDKYRIISGDGYSVNMLFEHALYKEIEKKKNKVKKIGITLIMTKDPNCEKNNKKIIDAFDHYCKELVPYNQSRYEIAQRLLHPTPVKATEQTEEDEENK